MSSAPEHEIHHVSDTALMVAACRALETVRADGLVRDPFAERLAGTRGEAILRGVTGWEMLCFGVAIRSRFMDELVTSTIAERGIATVLSVGAGLDTRPWRLDLPPNLRWIEVDFPDMIDYKASAMNQEQPKCRLEHLSADLNDAAQRGSMFAAAGTAPTLMITEGLLMYLPGSTVEALAVDSPAHSGIRFWILDSSSMRLAREVGMDTRQSIQNVRSPGHLEGEALLDAIHRNGWSTVVHRSYAREIGAVAADRVRSLIESLGRAGIQPPAPNPDDPSGVYLLAA